MTPDPTRISRQGFAVAGLVEKHGPALLKATRDWQSPLRSGGAKGPKGDHADPTYGAVAAPDPIAKEHGELVAALDAYHKAGVDLEARIRRLLPINPNHVQRGRINSVPTCLTCDGPAPRCRRGLCDSCYTAWLRAERPDMHAFRRDRLEALVPRKEQPVDPRDLRIIATRTTSV